MNNVLSEKINWSVALSIIIIAFIAILLVMFRYKNEGEKNMPINLSKILVVSSAGAESKDDDNNSKWNLSIDQYNDVYLNFEKNDSIDKNDYIESISIENINITKQPKIGNISIYMPSSSGEKDFSYEDIYLVESSLTYNGAARDNVKALQIARTGGTILFRIVNRNVGDFISNDDEEITYDGTLLQKAGLNIEDLKATVNFDVLIKTNRTAYRTNLTIDIPCEKVQEEGVVQNDPNDYADLIFKRERK